MCNNREILLILDVPCLDKMDTVPDYSSLGNLIMKTHRLLHEAIISYLKPYQEWFGILVKTLVTTKSG